MSGATESGATALEVNGCSKTFPGVRALTDVSIAVDAGEVRGLVGQNGAGKSTLIKVISGAEHADSGTVSVNGQLLAPGVAAHRDAGIAVIYQDPGVVPALSACENVFLGDLPTRGPFVDRGHMRARFEELCRELQVSIDPSARAASLSLGDRQLIEIMRAIRSASTVLILDEPTSALPEEERVRLFEVITRLSGAGLAVVFISHDLDDVLDVCDTVTVLRDGGLVCTKAASSMTRDDLVTAMTGQTIESAPRSVTDRSMGAEVLQITDLTTRSGADQVDLRVRAGEIVGLAGLLGSGRSEILRAIAGADRVQSGQISFMGEEVAWPRSVREAKSLGIHLVAEDRRRFGLVGGESTTMNVALGGFDRRRWFGHVSRSAEMRSQHEVLQHVGYPMGRESQPVRNLSGGNQQKVLLARLLALKPRVVLLDEPTAGIDVQATAQILDLVRGLASEGAAVIVVISDLQELIHACDRINVVRSGRIVGQFSSEAVTESDILHLAFAQPA
ncbi:sugar ABC transporter ATP-binding protein [Nonomuraea cavernae]|uniref:sugar ABC transporter ATP-binding protein n=1 Tax=Nonomuraea cavernae TaxID=2045107 RepID=UPI0033D9FC19